MASIGNPAICDEMVRRSGGRLILDKKPSAISHRSSGEHLEIIMPVSVDFCAGLDGSSRLQR
jgi:hypothetical protein